MFSVKKSQLSAAIDKDLMNKEIKIILKGYKVITKFKVRVFSDEKSVPPAEVNYDSMKKKIKI